jgi:hypothetical protein
MKKVFSALIEIHSVKKLVLTCEEGKDLADKVRKRAISTEVRKVNTKVVPLQFSSRTGKSDNGGGS